MVSANKFDHHSPVPVQKPVQVQRSTSKEHDEDVGGAVSHNWECGRQEKRREQAMCSHARHCWECGLIASMAHTSNRSTHASIQDPCLPVSDNCVPRKVDKVCEGIRWSLAAEPSHSGTHLVLNPCDYLGYLKDKVFSSAPRSLPELKERIKKSCAQVRRGMLTHVVHNFVLRLQAVRESQEAHIEHVIHNATHMWNSNPFLLLWHCFHINRIAIANALLSWKCQ
jgi:hypothetical protein